MMYEFEDDKETPPQKILKAWPETLVRVIGITPILTGLWASIQVLFEAMRLYRDPQNIESLAEANERGSNLDKSLVQSNNDESTADAGIAAISTKNKQTGNGGIRLSYFVAWIVALLILILVAVIALSFVRTGSELILQDKQSKHFARQLKNKSGSDSK